MDLTGRWFGGTTNGLYEHCGWHEGTHRLREESVTVTLNTEKAGASGVEVLRIEVLLVLCASCGGGLRAGSLRQDLLARRGPRKAGERSEER